MVSVKNTCLPINPKSKIADVLQEYNVLLPLMPRFGITLGFGECTCEEVCRNHCIPLPLFLLICRVYTDEGFVPDADEIRSCPIDNLLQYLKASHADYQDYRIVHIAKHLDEISQDWDKKYKALIINFFTDYKNELTEHFRYEETIVFPYLDDLIDHRSFGRRYKISAYKKNHSNIEDKLHDFTNLLMKYIPRDVAQSECVDMLLDMFAFAEDVKKHTRIEDKILIPYMQMLENEEKEY